jgi:uncharacterized protein
LLRYISILLLLLLGTAAFAADSDFPQKPNPPRLVNDLAHAMSADEVALLESKLLEYERTSSTQITVVTITNLGGYEVAQYTVELFNRWGIGQKGKENGVLILASIEDHKIHITTGYGLEGALTDATSGSIIRNQIVPQFKADRFYEGFSHGADAIIAATKGEYTADASDHKRKKGDLPTPAILIIIVVIYFIIWIMNKFRGGGGNYMSGRGHRDWGGGFYGGGFGGSGFGGGFGGGSSGGGFGGFGGGSSGGGGASGSW